MARDWIDRDRPRDWIRSRSSARSLEALSPAELAGAWGVHVQTIYRDIRKGALRAFRLPGGDIRIRVSDARRYGKPIP
jgi:excisionase family DNA binding protein